MPPGFNSEKTKQVFAETFNSSIGFITLVADSASLFRVIFGEGGDFLGKISFEKKWTSILCSAADELKDYLKGSRKTFSIPLLIEGTDFQRSVWDALMAIPYGETRTYGQIAAIIGNAKASRAVGNANNRNPLPIIIPCHRVVGASGSLVGFAGGLSVKQRLLDIEQGRPIS